jgi:hypothetical protein
VAPQLLFATHGEWFYDPTAALYRCPVESVSQICHDDVKIAVERNLGAGHNLSNIAQLLRLPLDEVERSFVNRSDDQFPRGKGLEK